MKLQTNAVDAAAIVVTISSLEHSKPFILQTNSANATAI